MVTKLDDRGDSIDESGDGDVGYGKPPRSTRFPPGQSGNPAGRPKGHRRIEADLQDELAKTLEITERGRKLMISHQKAIVRELVGAALGGDLRAIGMLFNCLSRKADTDADESASPADPLAPEDRDILENFVERGDEKPDEASNLIKDSKQ